MARRNQVGAWAAHLGARIRPGEAARLRGGVSGVERYTIVHWRGSRRRRVSHVLERGVVLDVVSHHGMLWRRVRLPRGRASHHGAVLVVVLIVPVGLAHEVFWAFVLVCAAILCHVVSAIVSGWVVGSGCLHIGSVRWSR